MNNKQSGFALIEFAVILVVVAAVAGVGYTIWSRQHTSSRPVTNSSSTSFAPYKSPPTSVPSAPQITNASDLNAALQALNQTSITSNNTDSNQLYAQASGF